ncbi:LLM class flavin-dependent oxidoreductase [Alicyclobacillus ferrooxydans]|uniref:Luciferase n=1 Tax=Alicyclobacillus ferrooxydans TaxID=471514 RepID=A0A0P9GSI3_9BACL|nr:LLM class flavin-dependent oxidoreductase [Alicyclobacillus ferrooxydans]KPV44008.1 luciferase [Alicyclobacillus ferrooxydans]
MKFSTFTVFDNYQNCIPRSVGQIYDEVAEQTILADELGYDAVWYAEHHFSEYGVSTSPQMLLASVARQTKRIRLGVSVSVLPLHDPIEIAEDYATLDILSGGRLNMGLGSGYIAAEFAGFQIPMEDKALRFNDAFDVLLKAWTGERFSHNGPYYQVPEVQLNVTPVQQPPEFWVASLRKEPVRYVARAGHRIMGIAYVNSNSRAEMADVIETYKDEYRARGHGDPDALEMPIAFHVHVAESLAEAEENAKEAINLYLRTRQYGKNIQYEDLRARQQAIFGTPDDVIEQIKAYQEIGVNHFMAFMNFGGLEQKKVLRSMELFAKHVMPAFQAAEVK